MIKEYDGYVFDLRPLELEELDGNLDLSKFAQGNVDPKVMMNFISKRCTKRPENSKGLPLHIIIGNLTEMTDGVFGKLLEMIKDGAEEAKKKLQSSA
jgi:hypothetical protein